MCLSMFETVKITRKVFFFSDKECKPIVDVAFLIDSSGSIGLMNWVKLKRFVKAIIGKLEVSPTGTHVAAIAYSTTPQIVLLFRNGQSLNNVSKAVDAMSWQRGFTFKDKALMLAETDLFQVASGMRPAVSKVTNEQNHTRYAHCAGFIPYIPQ